jgi:hypothetical protein
LAALAIVIKNIEPSTPIINIISDAGIVCDKSFIKKSSREKRAMEPTINSIGWSVESFKILSSVQVIMLTEL